MNNQYEYLRARIIGPDPNLRASDADREHIAERLRKSHAEGRLEMAEFQERLEHCYRAKTIGELRELVRDLPPERQIEPRAGGLPGAGRLGPVLPILVVLFFIAAASGHDHHVSWLWLPILFIVLRVSWWRRRRHWAGGRRPNDWT